MRHLKIVLIALFFVCAWCACDIPSYAVPGEEKAAGVFEKIYAAAPVKNGVKEISYDKFIELRKSGEKFILIDCLSSDDYNLGHIDGAISMPLKTINVISAKSKIPAGSNVVVYCLSYGCRSSTEAAQKISCYGHKVLDYKGGLDEWQQKGNALKK